MQRTQQASQQSVYVCLCVCGWVWKPCGTSSGWQDTGCAGHWTTVQKSEIGWPKSRKLQSACCSLQIRVSFSALTYGNICRHAPQPMGQKRSCMSKTNALRDEQLSPPCCCCAHFNYAPDYNVGTELQRAWLCLCLYEHKVCQSCNNIAQGLGGRLTQRAVPKVLGSMAAFLSAVCVCVGVSEFANQMAGKQALKWNGDSTEDQTAASGGCCYGCYGCCCWYSFSRLESLRAVVDNTQLS